MWWIFALLSALAQVLRNVLMKDLGHKLNEYVNVLGRFVFILPFALIYALYKGFPTVAPIYWVYSAAAGFFVTIATMYLSKAFKYSHISLSIALWKLAIIFLLVEEAIFLGAKISPMAFLGIVIIVVGIYLLNIKQAHVSIWEPFSMLIKDKGMKYALLSAIFVTQSLITFKITVDLSNASFPVFTNFAFATLFTLPIALKMSTVDYKSIKKHMGRFILMGFFAFLTTIFGTVAYGKSLATYVEAVKQSEIIFGLIVGALFFKEHKKIKEIWLGCFVILLGILLVVFNS